MTGTLEIRNGTVITPRSVIENGYVSIRNGVIQRVESSVPTGTDISRSIDAGGRYILPGIVDIHGDDIERQLFPRSNAQIDCDLALAMSDRWNLTSGVTTKFHAIAFEDSPSENRDVATATKAARSVHNSTSLIIDNRIHARCELSDRSLQEVKTVLRETDVDIVSLMHHTPNSGQFDSVSAFQNRYDPDQGWTQEQFDAFIQSRNGVSERTLDRRARRLVGLAKECDATIASHDDETKAEVSKMEELGVEISEYPTTMAAASKATTLGMTTAMGAPNLVRGGSLWGNLSAERAARTGVLDVLCSDFHPPSLLPAAFVDTGEPIDRRVRRITENPAASVGLHDRGKLEPGARGDVVIVDTDPVPTARWVIVKGMVQFTAEGMGDVDAVLPPTRKPGS